MFILHTIVKLVAQQFAYMSHKCITVDLMTTLSKFPNIRTLRIEFSPKVLSTYMEKLGLEYDTAMNGKEAVDLFCLPYRTYNCVLMDNFMPVMDGIEATRCIRAYEGREGQNYVPIIALSGLADAYSVDASLETLIF